VSSSIADRVSIKLKDTIVNSLNMPVIAQYERSAACGTMLLFQSVRLT
jgi:hypothetical protein